MRRSHLPCRSVLLGQLFNCVLPARPLMTVFLRRWPRLNHALRFSVWSAQAASMADALDVDDPASDFSAPSGASGVSRLSLTQKLSTSTPGSHQAHGCTSFVNTCHPAVVPVRRATPRHPHSPTAAEGSPVLHQEKMLCPAREQMPGAARGRRQDGRQQHWSGMTKVWTKAVLRFH